MGRRTKERTRHTQNHDPRELRLASGTGLYVHVTSLDRVTSDEHSFHIPGCRNHDVSANPQNEIRQKDPTGGGVYAWYF